MADTIHTQPEPAGPMDGEIRQCRSVVELAHVIQGAFPLASLDAEHIARAVLARWGTPNSAEIRRSLGESADGEAAELATAEMVRQLRTKATTDKANRCHYSFQLLTRAAHALPVPTND